jgi:hypothetical protein
LDNHKAEDAEINISAVGDGCGLLSPKTPPEPEGRGHGPLTISSVKNFSRDEPAATFWNDTRLGGGSISVVASEGLVPFVCHDGL